MDSQSVTFYTNMLVQKRKTEGLPTYNGGLGENPLPPPEQFVKILQNSSHDKWYKPVDGDEGLKNELIKHYTTDSYKVSKVVVGNGLKELLFVIQAVWSNTVVLIAPYWVSYIKHSIILNKPYKVFQTRFEDDYKIDLDRFREFLAGLDDKPLIIFNNPCNPTGIVYTENELKNLAELFREFKCVVVGDEIYIDIVHNNYQTCSLSKYYPEGTIIGNSISKQYGCGGYRLGWMVFPDELLDFGIKMASCCSEIYSCACSPVHHVAKHGVRKDEELQKYITNCTDLFSDIGEKCYDLITSQSKIRCSKPMGAWYMMFDFKEYEERLDNIGLENGTMLALRLIEDIGLVTISGSNFGCDQKYTIRYSYIDIDENNSYTNILEGLNKLCDWLNNL